MRPPRALVGIAIATAIGLGAGSATSQVPLQIGDGNPNVTIDYGVLDSLGPSPTVPQMLRPGTPVNPTGGYRPGAAAPAGRTLSLIHI